MKKTFIAAVAAVLIVGAGAGGGYVWALHQGQARLQQATQQIRSALGPNGSFSYDASVVHPLRRSADLVRVVLRLPTGVQWTADNVTVADTAAGKIGSLSARGLRFVDPADASVVTIATLDGTDIRFPPQPPGRTVAVDPGAISFSNLGLNRSVLTEPGASVQVASMTVTNYGAGRASRLRLAGIAVPLANAAPFDSFGVASTELSGFDFASALSALARQAPLPPILIGPGRLAVDGLYAATGNTKSLTVAQAVLSTDTQDNGAITLADLKVTGITASALDQQLKAFLDAFQLPHFEIGLSSQASYHIAGGRFEISPSVAVKDLGALTLKAKLVHLDITGLNRRQPDIGSLLGIVNSVQFVSGALDFQDHGLRQRFLAARERQTGQPEAAIRSQLVQSISNDQDLLGSSAGKQLQDVLISYIEHGGGITATLQPPQPVGFAQLMGADNAGPAQLFATAGMTFTTTSALVPAESPQPKR